MRDYFGKNESIQFVSPIDGDFVNIRDGKAFNSGIIVPFTVAAPENAEIYIDGVKAEYSEGLYRADVKIFGYRNTVICEDRTNGTVCRANVYHAPEAVGKYRVSSDDNILFLQDITANKDKYTSIFDNSYLAVYKKAHDLYGAKVHLNLFYESNEETMACFGIKRDRFDLSMMTDKFRDEFRANADWLKLAFHAYAEFPDSPYKHASAEKIREDCIKVCKEIVRFAGREVLNDSTTVHWGDPNHECVRALRSLGIRSLTGCFEHNSDGIPVVSYYATDELIDHVGERDFWYDTEEDMIFGRIDLILNLNTYDWVQGEIRKVAAHPTRSGFVSVMMHEQYFYPDYENHLPDFEERVLDTCKFLSEKGYVGAHISDVVREPNHREHPLFK